jgi:hypothetical protein
MHSFRSARAVVTAATLLASLVLVQSQGAAQAPRVPRAGEWYDGGSGCASTQAGRAAGTIVLRIWYCEAGRETASPLTMEYDRAAGTYLHRATGIRLQLSRSNTIRVVAPRRTQQPVDGSIYIADGTADYARQR